MKSENTKEEMCQNTDNEKLRRSINRNTDLLDSLAKEVKELKEALPMSNIFANFANMERKRKSD